MNNSSALPPVEDIQGSRGMQSSPQSGIPGNWITLLSTSFPPKGGSGVQRPYYQAKFLSKLGWNVRVVTVSSPGAVRDHSFAPASSFGVHVTEIPPSLVRTALNFFEKADRKLRRRFLFPDEFKLWSVRAARHTASALHQRHVVLASVGSPSALSALIEVKKAASDRHLRTVVDFRDFWALNQRADVPEDRRGNAKQKTREQLERKVLRTVDGVIVVSEAYKRRLMAAYPWLLAEQVLVVENGYVESDFADVEKTLSSNKRRNTAFTIRYTGFLLRDHNPDLFFAGLKLLKEKNPAAYQSTRFEYYGGNPAFVEELAAAHGVSDICSFEGYTPHSRAVELILTADALYLPFARGDGTIGGKTYEYIRSGRPLVPTLFDCEEPRQILAKFGISDCIPRGAPESVAAVLMQMAEAWRTGQLADRPRTPLIGSIERLQQTSELGAWLERLLDAPT